MNKRLASLLMAYSAFSSFAGGAKTTNNIRFERTNIKGLSSKEMGTCGNKKKSRKRRKIKNGKKK